jgi:hypothetical protein
MADAGLMAVLLLPITIMVIAGSLAKYLQNLPPPWRSTMEVFVFLIIPMLLLNGWFFYKYGRAKSQNQKLENEYKTFGQSISATLIDKEKTQEIDNAPTYWLYYQYAPDFIVKAELKNRQKPYFDLAIGSTLTIEYLPQEPTRSRLK